MRSVLDAVPRFTSRRTLRVFALVGSLLSGAGCGASRAASVPPVTPPSVIPDSARIAIPAVTRLANASERYAITVVSQSLEAGAEGRSDSSTTRNVFSAALTALPTSDFLFALQGRRVVIDSTLSREQRMQLDSMPRILLEIDAQGRRMSVQPAVRDSCQGEGTLLSPLIARLLTVPPVVLRQGAPPVRDSLEYVSCSGATRLHTMSRLSFQPMNDGVIQVEIDGTVRADSARALPMHLTGLFSGKATITPDVTYMALADRVSLTLELHLRAASSLRRQQFTQRTWTTVERSR